MSQAVSKISFPYFVTEWSLPKFRQMLEQNLGSRLLLLSFGWLKTCVLHLKRPHEACYVKGKSFATALSGLWTPWVKQGPISFRATGKQQHVLEKAAPEWWQGRWRRAVRWKDHVEDGTGGDSWLVTGWMSARPTHTPASPLTPYWGTAIRTLGALLFFPSTAQQSRRS